MTDAFVIRDSSSGMPSFFALKVAKDYAANNGWVTTPKDALAFARKADAEAFIEKYLPHLSSVAEPFMANLTELESLNA